MTPTAPGPGLDLAALRALAPSRHDEHALTAAIRDHLDQHDGYVSFSGGKDSLVVLDLALRAEPAVPVCFFDSGLEYPETIDYLSVVEDHYAITITTYPARPSLLEILVANGTWDHHAANAPHAADIKTACITAPASRARADWGPGTLWGLRADESTGRDALFRAALAHPCTCCPTRKTHRARHGGRTWQAGHPHYSPIWDWTSHEVLAHIARHQIPLNPVYQKLAALGAPASQQRVSHILDASHLTSGRAAWLRRGWPDLWARLQPLLPRLPEYL